ncbi:MAG: hypothetical protein JWL70_1616 [Acidimicrobiia bacterium]|nr:hypothetical protein [Acidimicrobiia bacterium]
MSRLRKREVERLLATYDQDPIASLTEALRVVLERPDANWSELLATAPLTDQRWQRLIAGEQAALDELAAELNERRQL